VINIHKEVWELEFMPKTPQTSYVWAEAAGPNLFLAKLLCHVLLFQLHPSSDH